MSRAEEFEQLRALLFAIAYRILGSVSEAEDAVQETWLRYEASPTQPTSTKAFLSAVVTRISIDVLPVGSLSAGEVRRALAPGAAAGFRRRMVEARARGLRAVEGGSSVHPDGNGLQFAEVMRKADRRVAVFVLTISLGADDHCRAPELDADAVPSKAAALDDITDDRRRLRLSSDPESVVSEKRGYPPY